MFPVAFARLFDSTKWPLFLTGAVALALLGNATHDLLKTALGDDALGLALILLIGLGALFGAAWLLARRLNRPGTIVPPTRAQPPVRRGLILLVGMRDEACREAIRHHRGSLERVWLLCSTAAQSRETAAKLAGDSELLGGVVVETVVVEDVYDPRGAFNAVTAIRARLPNDWHPDDVIADFTGLTAAASVGMVIGCLQTGIRIEYTPAEYDATGRALRSLPPHEVVFRDAVRLLG